MGTTRPPSCSATIPSLAHFIGTVALRVSVGTTLNCTHPRIRTEGSGAAFDRYTAGDGLLFVPFYGSLGGPRPALVGTNGG